MTMDNLKDKSLENLMDDLNHFQNTYNELVYNHSIAPLEKSHIIKISRRDIARIKTEIRRRELSIESNTVNRDRILERRRKGK
jgi:large subunit ribosomal protein L29